MIRGLPLEIVGLVAPILARVEDRDEPVLGNDDPVALEKWYADTLPTYTRDNFREICKLAGDNRSSGFRLNHIFRKLSDHYLCWSGNSLCIRRDRIVELHELSLRFPTQHLIHFQHARTVLAGLASREQVLSLPVNIAQLPSVCRVLHNLVKRGLTDTHLHLNGVLGGDYAWANDLFVAAFDANRCRKDKHLLRIRIVTAYLALILLYQIYDPCAGRHVWEHGRKWLESRQTKRLLSALDLHFAGFALDTLYRDLEEMLDRECGFLLRNIPSNPSEHNTSWNLMVMANPCWAMSHGTASEGESQNCFDVMNRILRVNRFHFELHRCLCQPACKSTTRKGWMQHWFHDLLLRYLVLQTQHRRQTIHGEDNTGLRVFRAFFGARKRRLECTQLEDYHRVVMEALAHEHGLEAVEGRISPRDGDTYRLWLKEFAHKWDQNKLKRFSLIINFIKKEERYGNNDRVVEVTRGALRRITAARARALFRFLSTPGPAVPFMCGIDAASLELAAGPDIFAPTFRFLRQYPITVYPTTRRGQRIKTWIERVAANRRLGMTYHVGEEFRHLLSGLCVIREAIDFLKPIPGDRLGHAVALALNPQSWAARIGCQAVVTRQEWLDTLVWLYHFMGHDHELMDRLGLEEDLIRMARQIYYQNEGGSGHWRPEPNINTLYDAWVLRQLDPFSLHPASLEAGCLNIMPQQNHSPEFQRWHRVQQEVLAEIREHESHNAVRLLNQHWYDPDVRRAGEHVIAIDMKSDLNRWVDLCLLVQQRMLELVIERELVIEVNPSSNRIIGHLDNFEDHPIFRLTLDRDKHLSRNIRVSVNSDDPGIFATSLTHEFYILGEILLHRGIPEPEVENWLEWLRRNGREFAFHADLPSYENILQDWRSIVDQGVRNRYCGQDINLEAIFESTTTFPQQKMRKLFC